MTTDFEAVKAGLQAVIPFNNHLGLRYEEVSAGRSVVTLPDDPRLHNHIATQHAAGMFAAGEAASGGAFAGTFADLMGSVVPLAESAEISYKKIARGPLTATAVLEGDREALLVTLEDEGRMRFPVRIELTDEAGLTVAEMVVRWYVKKS
ncbi:MAG: DUF4442 domain-containing protein [Actinomycetota bacterium]